MKKIFDKEKLFFFIRKPRFALVISVCIVIMGFISMISLKQESYPDVTPPQVRVSANYQGASAEVIESSVATVLENKLNGVEDMTYMTSTSYDGSYSLTLYFKVGSDKNINLMNVQNRIQQVQSQLPEDVQRTGVTAISRTSGSGAIILTLYPESGNWTQLDLTNYGSIYIKDELKRIDGVADVEVFGGGNYSMRIWLDPQKMAGLNISTSEVKTAIANQNTQVTAGALGQLPTDEPNALQLTLKTQGRLDELVPVQVLGQDDELRVPGRDGGQGAAYLLPVFHGNRVLGVGHQIEHPGHDCHRAYYRSPHWIGFRLTCMRVRARVLSFYIVPT